LSDVNTTLPLADVADKARAWIPVPVPLNSAGWMMSLPAERVTRAPPPVIAASIKTELLADRVRLWPDDHRIGEETVMLPASEPGLPAPPVDTITFELASWLSRVK
jgi:hypothetical protein